MELHGRGVAWICQWPPKTRHMQGEYTISRKRVMRSAILMRGTIELRIKICAASPSIWFAFANQNSRPARRSRMAMIISAATVTAIAIQRFAPV